jgi:hypothetical protein
MRLESHKQRFGDNARGLDRANRNTQRYAAACHDVVSSLARPSSIQVLNMFNTLIEHAAVDVALADGADATEVYLSGSQASTGNEIENGGKITLGYSEIDAQLRPLYSDGLHFSREGQAVVFQSILDKVDSAFPHLSYDKLPNHLPWHTDIKANPSFLDTTLPREYQALHLKALARGAAAAVSQNQPMGAGSLLYGTLLMFVIVCVLAGWRLCRGRKPRRQFRAIY